MREAAMGGNCFNPEEGRDETVDVWQVGRQDQRRHRVGRQPLEARATEDRSDEAVG